MKKLLVPTDFSENARNALPYAIAIANLFGAEIHLVHTYRIHSTTGSFISVESFIQEDAAQEMLKLVREIERQLKNGAKIETKAVRGEAVSTLVRLAQKEPYDLIVMGTQGASGLKEIFLGSTTNGVVQKTKIPLLAVPSYFTYRPIRRIVLAIDELGFSQFKVVAPLVNLIRALKAETAVYHKDTGAQDRGIDPSVNMFLEDVEYSVHYELAGDGVNESINSFVLDYEADLLCMIRRKAGVLEKIFHSSHTSKEVFNSPVPLLVLQGGRGV